MCVVLCIYIYMLVVDITTVQNRSARTARFELVSPPGAHGVAAGVPGNGRTLQRVAKGGCVSLDQ